MAKAKEITGLDCSADAPCSAAKILRVRFDETIEFRGAALHSKDIEAVHDMRVATRRLRSALRDFAPLLKKRRLKKISKDLKNLADALGIARDQDVAIIALEKLQAKAENVAVKESIGKLIDQRRAVRERGQISLTEILAEGKINELQTRFSETIEQAFKIKKSGKDFSFKQIGQDIITANLQEFCNLSEKIYEPFNGQALHKLRIATKCLRYSIQLFAVCWNEQIASFAKEIAEMQSFLGEVHDADIWIEGLSKRLEENQGIEIQANLWLLSEFIKDRDKNYSDALELWGNWKNNKFIENLREMLSQ